jgi:hypothetical protein
MFLQGLYRSSITFPQGKKMKNPLRWILVLVLASALAYTDSASPPLLPSPALTPGDVLTTDAKVVCTPGYTKTVRDVPQSVKNQVYRAYGITSHKPGEYEIDHLVSLELGGSNSIRNLWPQSYVTEPQNAHVKDTLENVLHELVCSGKLSLKEAQKAIATNWIQAYEQYVGPLRSGASSREGETEGSCPSSAPVKVSRSGIYHLPGDPSYKQTKAKHCFATGEAAEAAGYRASKH